MGIETLVAVPALSTQAPNPAYNLEQFIYHKETDTYQCPRGNLLHTNGSWYNKEDEYGIKVLTKRKSYHISTYICTHKVT
jgi:hypothetical protein